MIALPTVTAANYNNYIEKIKTFPMLMPEDVQVKLLMAYIEDENAIKDLLHSNMRFVISVAKKFQSNGYSIPLPDLINSGNKGLLEAIRHYHHGHDHNKFTTVLVIFSSNRIKEDFNL
jgi:RNA polymerase primary sigma factor